MTASVLQQSHTVISRKVQFNIKMGLLLLNDKEAHRLISRILSPIHIKLS